MGTERVRRSVIHVVSSLLSRAEFLGTYLGSAHHQLMSFKIFAFVRLSFACFFLLQRALSEFLMCLLIVFRFSIFFIFFRYNDRF